MFEELFYEADSDEVFIRMVGEFCTHFESCDRENCDYLTTEDICASFQEFYPGKYQEEDLIKHLNNVFKFKYIPDLKRFVWLIRKKNS